MAEKNNIPNIPSEKFVFVERSEKISDVKLDTKPVSFAQDAFKRFCKNKSSVVAAFILGILIILAIFGPMISGIDINRVSTTENFLEPKLFEAGTGFWDGTTKQSRVVFDTVKGVPADYYAPAVMNLKVDEEPTLINVANNYGIGGYVMFENEKQDGKTKNTLYNYYNLTITADGNYRVAIDLGDTQDAIGHKLGRYRITFAGSGTTLVLRDWGTDYSDFTANLSEALTAEGLEKLSGKLTFELESQSGVTTYLLIKSCVFTADESVSNADDLATIGFTDATKMVLIAKDALGRFPQGYWQCDGRKGIFEAQIYYCDFTYDTYALVYDEQEVVYPKSKLDELVDQGLCTYEYDLATRQITSFTVLSDACPFNEIISVQANSTTGRLSSVTVLVARYKAMGYDEMPKFIFGTDVNGVDVFTRMFQGLRTSLLLGVCTFAFCFLFGLVWGAISGYFGGWVDLSMERFCDILGGVPWIVVMTLCILHLGNNFSTFFLALCMTGWMGTAARTRTQFYRFKGMEHVLAARTLGASDMRLIFKHILPNSLGTIITSAVLMIPSVIFSEATLAYLNLGLQGVPSFGVMLSDNQQYLNSHSYLIIIPSVVIALLEISFNLFGNGLRDAVNPTLRGSEG